MSIEIWISGFLYLLILILQIIMASFGYILEPTPKHYELDEKLLKFNNSPNKFKMGVVFALIEHVCVITLAITLFLVVNPYNILLGIILIIFRGAEGSIQVYIEKDYWKLLNIADKYSATNDTQRNPLLDSYRSILQTKSKRFAFAMIGWSIGTFSFSIVIITHAVALPFIGWLGFVASILIGFSNGLKLSKPNVKAYETISSMSGLLSILFEILIGISLLFFPPIIS